MELSNDKINENKKNNIKYKVTINNSKMELSNNNNSKLKHV